ncbi:MAG: hypothetical protein ACREBG_18465 [Pyrinomonadaceae bacterium]
MRHIQTTDEGRFKKAWLTVEVWAIKVIVEPHSLILVSDVLLW